MSLQLQKGTALVTGASSGIGEAFARLLATKGINLILTARRQDRLQVIAQELAGPIRVDIINCDLSDKAGAERLIKAVEDLNVAVDILVNNAVNSTSGRASELADDVWMNHINTKVLG